MIVERFPLSENSPYSVQDAMLHVRVDTIPEFMGEIDRQARAAVAELEHYAQIALLYQTIRVTLPCWRSCWRDGRPMSLPVGPVTEGATVTMTASGQPVEGVALLTGLRPSLRCYGEMKAGEVVIEYRAGFGDDHWKIPADLLNAINDQVGVLFDERGTEKIKHNGMSPHMARTAARYRPVRL